MGLLAWAHVALFITITSGFDVYTDDNIHDVVKNGWLNYRSSNNLPKCCSDNNCKMVRLSSTLYKKVNQKGDQLRFSLRDGDDKMGAILSYSHQKGISGTVFFKKERKAYFLETIPEHEANDQSSPCYKSRYARSRYLFYRMKFIKSTDGKIPKQFLSANSAKAESPCCWGFMCKGVTGVDTGTLRADKNGALPDLYVPRGNQPASDLSEVFTMTATQPRKCRPTCTVYFYHNNRNEMLTISKSGSDSWSLHLEAEDGKDLRLKKCVDGQFLTQSRAASGKTLIPMRPAAKPKPSGSSKKASGKLSGGPKLPAGGYGMKKEKPTNTKFHEIDVSMQRVAPGEQCWYPNYICNQLKHVKKWFYLDATDPTKDDEDWIMDCYESFAECGGDCTHFTYSNYGGRPECTLHDGCDAVYNSKCFELGKCRSGPGDCEPLMANKNCTSAPDLGPDYSTWQCMDRMGKKLGPVQPNAPLPSATFCIIGCDSWLDTASTPANPIQGILSSRCQNDGTWSATTPLNGAPTLTYPLPPYPLPTAGVGESPSPLSCACPDLTLTLDGQVYDPNAEEAASFTCFSKNTFDPVTGFKIQANDVCILLCDGNHALTVMCSDQGWTNSPELGIWCYEKPDISNPEQNIAPCNGTCEDLEPKSDQEDKKLHSLSGGLQAAGLGEIIAGIGPTCKDIGIDRALCAVLYDYEKCSRDGAFLGITPGGSGVLPVLSKELRRNDVESLVVRRKCKLELWDKADGLEKGQAPDLVIDRTQRFYVENKYIDDLNDDYPDMNEAISAYRCTCREATF